MVLRQNRLSQKRKKREKSGDFDVGYGLGSGAGGWHCLRQGQGEQQGQELRTGQRDLRPQGNHRRDARRGRNVSPVKVTGGNKDGRAAARCQPQMSFAVVADGTKNATKIELDDVPAALADLQAGDTVVQAKTSKGTIDGFTAHVISAESPEVCRSNPLHSRRRTSL